MESLHASFVTSGSRSANVTYQGKQPCRIFCFSAPRDGHLGNEKLTPAYFLRSPLDALTRAVLPDSWAQHASRRKCQHCNDIRALLDFP